MELRRLIQAHVEHTGSARGRMLLQDWERRRGEFVRVIPSDYRKVLEREEQSESERPVRAARAGGRRLPTSGIPT